MKIREGRGEEEYICEGKREWGRRKMKDKINGQIKVERDENMYEKKREKERIKMNEE